MALIYTHQRCKPKSNAKLKRLNNEHEQWLLKQGLHSSQIKRVNVNELPDYYCEKKYELSNSLGNGFKTDIMTHLHKESPEVQKAILEKAARTAPAFSKGAYQYVTDGADKKTLGRKV